MSRVIVISDTHSSQNYLSIILSKISDIQPDYVIHLGDYYDDAQSIIDAGFQVVRVPGTWTPYYKRTDIENRLYHDIEGWTLFLTHTPTPHYNDLPLDINPQDVIRNRQAHILMHGHTHHPKLDVQNKTIILNPGHLYERDNRGYPPTFADLDFTQDRLSIKIIELLSQREWASETYSKFYLEN